MQIKISKFQNEYRLKTTTELPKPLAEVFSFFSSAKNLEILTPPFLGFNIATQGPIEMSDDTIIKYNMKLYGMAIKWTTLISSWSEPHSFIDEQLTGPYRY